jgi:hypothetical protein
MNGILELGISETRKLASRVDFGRRNKMLSLSLGLQARRLMAMDCDHTICHNFVLSTIFSLVRDIEFMR